MFGLQGNIKFRINSFCKQNILKYLKKFKKKMMLKLELILYLLACVVAETILGEPIFPGKSAVDQLVEIIKVIGTPTNNDIIAMNPDYK